MEVLLEIALYMISLPVLAIGLTIASIAGYTRARRKGYRPPAVVLVLLCGACLGLTPVFYLLPKVVFGERTQLIFIVVFWIPAVVSVVATALIIRLLPSRNARIEGRRRTRFPLAAAGVALIAAGVAFVVWGIWEGGSWSDGLGLLPITTGFGLSLIALGQRAKSAPSIEEATDVDSRAPVLYLRSFRQEGSPFVVGKKSQYGRYLSEARSAITSGDEDTDFTVSVRFEQYFAHALNARVGPFVGLGNPEDYLPPEGASRTYGSDSDWRLRVERLVAACSCMVAEVAISKNLEWELRYIRERELQTKLFIMTPPIVFKVNRRIDRLFVWARQIEAVSWSAFKETMTACGYEVEEEPGVGSVLTFDAAGKSVVLKTGVRDPEEYVESIRSFLEASAGYAAENLDQVAETVPAPSPLEVPDAPAPPTGKGQRTIWRRLLSTAAIWGGALLILLASIVMYDQVKEHRAAVRAEAARIFASQIKFRFNDGAVTFVDNDLAGAWNSGVVVYEMEGSIGDLQALLFDFTYETKSDDRDGGQTTHEWFETVAAFSRDDQKLPSFDLQRYSLSNALNLTGEESSGHVDFDDSPEFSTRFILTGPDKAAIRNTFSPQLRGFLMNSYPQGEWHIKGAGHWLMVYRPDVRVKTENWKSFFDQTSETARGFYQNVGAAPQTRGR